jgi:hypothetical protein
LLAADARADFRLLNKIPTTTTAAAAASTSLSIRDRYL